MSGTSYPFRQARQHWLDFSRRQGWEVRFTTVGGRLRSWDPATLQNVHRQSAVSHAAILVTNDRTGPDSDAEFVALIAQRILCRGDRPPVDPLIEHALLRKAGLWDRTEARAAGDLARQFTSTEGLPDDASVDAAITYRAKFEFPEDLMLDRGGELVRPDSERPFIDWICHALGPDAGHWLTPQAPLGSLVGTPDAVDERRVDFLFDWPLSRPVVIEIDGWQHLEQKQLDEERDAALLAGIDVVRLPTRAEPWGDNSDLQQLRDSWRRPVPDNLTTLLTWGPVVAHRTAFGLAEACARGWLHGPTWRITVDEPLGIAEEAVRSFLELWASICTVWGVDRIPTEVNASLNGQASRFVRAGAVEYSCLPPEPATATDLQAHIAIEPFYGPYHRLERNSRTPTVVVRSALLPVQPLSDQLSGGQRRTANESAGVSDGLKRLLRYVFAKEQFRPDDEPEPRRQEVAIRRLLAGRDVAVLLPTGAGKSLIYQLAGLLTPGMTLVVDPIVALIDDQVIGLAEHGFDRVIGITSADSSAGLTKDKFTRIRAGDVFFVFVAPERLQQQSFRDTIRGLAVASPVNLLVVDEAHCVSEWGHDFRTSYLGIGGVLRRVTADLAGVAPPLVALTGTASRAVLKDMLIELGIDRSDPAAIMYPSKFDRPELRFTIVRADDEEVPTRLQGVLQGLPRMFKERRVPRKVASFFTPSGRDTVCGLVFCQTVRGSETGLGTIARSIQANMRIPTGKYAGSAPHGVDAAQFEIAKRADAARFKRNEISLMVATKAFGMGIDKPNVCFVIHVGTPSSIEAYYQEVGRAGRDRVEAQCVLLHHAGARRTQDYFHRKTFPGIELELERLLDVLDALGDITKLRRVRIPFGVDDEARERAIHRLRVLGVVKDYLVDWGAKAFRVHVNATSAADIRKALVEFVRRAQPARAPALERELAGTPEAELKTVVADAARRLIEFVYDTIVAARRRAAEEMFALAEQAADDAEIRDRILRYMSVGHVSEKIDRLVEQQLFSFQPWYELYADIYSIDDARDWRGATARLLGSYPDHPGLLVGRGIVEAVLPHGDLATFTRNILGALSAARARYALTERDVESCCLWLIRWCRERRPDWVGAMMVTAERALGTSHLQHLGPAEDEALRAEDPHADEIGVVLSRRLERLNDRLTLLTRR